jgi:hypothetical protein
MGHKHVNTLQETASAAFQERVGESIKPGKIGNDADARSTARILPGPLIRSGIVERGSEKIKTYAEAVKRPRRRASLESERRKVSFSHSQEIIPSY